jgi:hypothetical protein
MNALNINHNNNSVTVITNTSSVNYLLISQYHSQSVNTCLVTLKAEMREIREACSVGQTILSMSDSKPSNSCVFYTNHIFTTKLGLIRPNPN